MPICDKKYFYGELSYFNFFYVMNVNFILLKCKLFFF